MNESAAVVDHASAAVPDSSAEKAIWAAGDLDRFCTQLIWELGPMLVEACAIKADERVLDVAGGSGNVALRAAARGARVVASDLVAAHLDAGRRHADALGLTLDWREADAQALPFARAQFDVVTSSLGVIFANDHVRAANELLRVCCGSGRIGLICFTPTGLGGTFFDVFRPFMPPPAPGTRSPLDWGDEAYLRQLFDIRVARLDCQIRTYVEHAASPLAYRDFVIETFGPAVALRASLALTPARLNEFDQKILEFAREANSGPRGGPAEFVYEVLLAVAHRGPH